MFVVIHLIIQSMNDVFLFEFMSIYFNFLCCYNKFVWVVDFLVKLCCRVWILLCRVRDFFNVVSVGVRVMGVGLMTLLFKLLICINDVIYIYDIRYPIRIQNKYQIWLQIH